MPPDIWKRIQAGHDFNKKQRPHYDNNEVRLDSRKIVDSYRHRREIVERKYSQLAKIKIETAIGYLNSIVRKYSPGRVIADVPSNRAECADLVGEEIDGEMILEVPVQDQPVSAAILKAATDLEISIRDTEGKVYNP